MSATQIKVTLPLPLHDFLASKANKLGLTLSSYVKNLIIDDVKNMEIPEFRASKQVEENYQKSLQNQKQGKLKEIDNLDEYFSNL